MPTIIYSMSRSIIMMLMKTLNPEGSERRRRGRLRRRVYQNKASLFI